MRAYLEAFTRANSADFAGVPFHQAPPAHGSMQFWRRYVHSGLGAGQQTVKLPHVGNHLRTLILINKTSSARSTADFPASVTLNIDGNTLEGSIAKVWLQHRMAERYGLDGAIGAAGGLDTGVFVIDFCHDLDGKPGFETRDGYLPTTPATYLELSGVFGASADSLTILTNDVAIKHAA